MTVGGSRDQPAPAAAAAGGLALDVRGLTLAFGGLKAVTELSLQVPTGGLHGLIGPNGAGKTTAFNLLTGVYRPDGGTMALHGQRIDGLKPNAIARAGLARTFQNIRLFGELSVLDNVRVAAGVRARSGLVRSLLRTPLYLAEERAIVERSRELLDTLGIAHRADEQARSLPYGDQRRLEIARALATEPRLLLLDEPVAGMNTPEKKAMRGLIQSLRERFGVSILLIEHDMGLVMDICEHITVLDHGVTIAAGAPDSVQKNPAVIAAYLGVPEDAMTDVAADTDSVSVSVSVTGSDSVTGSGTGPGTGTGSDSVTGSGTGPGTGTGTGPGTGTGAGAGADPGTDTASVDGSGADHTKKVLS